VFDDAGAAGDGDDNGDGDAKPPVRGLYALGAPEMLRPSLATTAADASWDQIVTQARPLTNRGLRVLLVAHAPTTTLEDHGEATRLPGGLTPLGLVSLSDELRPEARAALAAFIAAGVRPVIISGDDPETVAALARQAGLGADGGDLGLVSGLDLATMDEAAFAAAAAAGTVFGRITPQQKEHLVRVFRARGAYVAMIGDGVNDVLSLKAANLGIAMQSGSQATRGVADLVLLDDSFAALVPAVAEGQRIVNGMRHILSLFLTRIASVGLVILSALVVGAFPLALRQGSLVTLLSVGVPSVFLVLWARPGPTPTEPGRGRLARVVLPPVVLTGALSLLVFYGALLLHLARAGVSLRPLAQTQAQLTRISASDLATAQTALVSFLVLSGLLLVVFAEPPTAWWTGAAALSGDWRPTALAAGLAAAFVAVSLAPPPCPVRALSAGATRERPGRHRSSRLDDPRAVDLAGTGTGTPPRPGRVVVSLWGRAGAGPRPSPHGAGARRRRPAGPRLLVGPHPPGCGPRCGPRRRVCNPGCSAHRRRPARRPAPSGRPPLALLGAP